MAEWNEQAANDAATEAREELTTNEDFTDIAQWWNKYYLAAGHKRLGRVILDIAREMDILGDMEQKKQSDYQ